MVYDLVYMYVQTDVHKLGIIREFNQFSIWIKAFTFVD